MKPAPLNPDGTLINRDPDGNVLRFRVEGERPICNDCKHNRWSAWCDCNGGRFARSAHPGNYAGGCRHFVRREVTK